MQEKIYHLAKFILFFTGNKNRLKWAVITDGWAVFYIKVSKVRTIPKTSSYSVQI